MAGSSTPSVSFLWAVLLALRGCWVAGAAVVVISSFRFWDCEGVVEDVVGLPPLDEEDNHAALKERRPAGGGGSGRARVGLCGRGGGEREHSQRVSKTV